MKKVILMLAVAAMASCSKSEVETRPVTAGDVEIRATSKVLAIDTRAPYMDKLDTDGQKLEAYVIASTSKTDYATAYAAAVAPAAATEGKWCEGVMKFGSGYVATPTPTGAFSDPVGFTPTSYYYPMDDAIKLYMVGLVPTGVSTTGTASETEWAISGTPTTTGVILIDGKTDIMAAAVTTNAAGNDIKRTEAQAGNHPKFTFKHLLTKLDVYVKADTEAATAFGKITKMELKDALNQCTVTLDGATAAVTSTTTAFAASSKTTCPFYLCDYTTATTNDPAYQEDAIATGKEIDLKDIVDNYSGEAFAAYAMVNPVWVKMANAENPYVLHIESENGYSNDVKVKLVQADNTTAFEESTQGKQFKVVLTFKATEILASATVTPWDTTGTGNSDVTVD